MTATTGAHVDSSIQELWAKLTLRDHLRAGFWGSKTGPEGSRSPIIVRTDLVNQPGDTIHIQVTNPLAGSGVAGDETALEGSEENLTTSSMKVIPLFYRHAVRWYRRAAKKSLIDLRSEARMRLGEWGGEKMDDVRFAAFVSTATLNGETYTPNTYFVGTGNVAIADVATGDYLTVVDLQKIKLKLYQNRAIPLKTADGEDIFGLVAHHNTLYYLKRDSEYRDWVKDAEVRGKDNPFFRGAIAMIDGMVIFQHSNVPTALDGTSSASISRNIAFGAEAFIEGVDESPSWNEDDFDYGNQFGIAYSFGFQPRRALAKNSVVVYASATDPLA